MRQRDGRALLLLLAGFTTWSVGFVTLYALQALGCAYHWDGHRFILAAAFAALLLPLAWLALRRPYETGEPATTLSLAALWANRAAFAAAILVFSPVLFVTICV